MAVANQAMLFDLPAGVRVGRFGDKPVLLGGLATLAASMAAMSTATEPWAVALLAAPLGAAHAAWQGVLDRYGLEKKSRIGYSIGVGYSPDWGEHTISIRPGELTEIPENAVLHVILGMWMADWGMEISETIHVRAGDATCLTHFPREVFVKGA